MKRRGAKRVGLEASAALVGLLLTAALAYPSWLPTLGRYLHVDDGLHPARAVIALTGEPERVAYAAELVRDGLAERLVLTPLALPSEAERAQHLRQMRALAVRHGAPADAVLEVPEPASSTLDEARGLRPFLGAHGIESALVVTSKWHTRRSHIVFDRVFPSTVPIHVVPVPDRVYEEAGSASSEDWWRHDEARTHVLLEYAKIIAQSLGVQ